jgi:hypothetical protein
MSLDEAVFMERQRGQEHTLTIDTESKKDLRLLLTTTVSFCIFSVEWLEKQFQQRTKNNIGNK